LDPRGPDSATASAGGDFGHIQSREGPASSQQLEQQDTECILIASVVDPGARLELFRRAVARSSAGLLGHGEIAGRREQGEPEVCHQRPAVSVEQNVVRLQVAVNDPVVVDEEDGLGDVADDEQGVFGPNRSPTNGVGQRAARHEFGDDEDLSLVDSVAVDRDDARMAQAIEHRVLFPTGRWSWRVGQELGAWQFYGDRLAAPQVGRDPDHPEPAPADRMFQPVAPVQHGASLIGRCRRETIRPLGGRPVHPFHFSV
jgi:hypothetical protein